jgi:hypothetical protein
MSSPSFSKNTPNKIGTGIKVSGRNTLIKTADNDWRVAIADEPIDAKVDGTKMFCVRVDIAVDSGIMIGFTPMETFDSESEAYFGYNDFTGCGINLYNGNIWYPVEKNHNIIDRGISLNAKEIIVILTISNNGTKKEIRFFLDGKQSESTDVSEYFKGALSFPVIVFSEKNQQVTTIPIDEIKTRTPEIESMIKEHQQQNNQSGGAVASSSSSAAMIQLQKELDEALQKIAALSSQLQQEKQQHEKQSKEKDNQLQQKELQLQQKDAFCQQKDYQLQQEKQKLKEKDDQLQQEKRKSSDLEKEVQQLKQQLLSLSSSNQNQNQGSVSPFVADKPYQIDLAKNGVKPPSDPNAFGTILPVLQTSPLFQHVKNELWKKLGTMFPSPKSVADFTLEQVEIIYSEVSSLETRMRRLQQLRNQGGDLFNPASGAFTAEQLQSLIAFRDRFLSRSSSADPKTPNLVNVFHGTRISRLQSVVNGLVAVRSTDAGFFGLGCYTTTSIEYAARYAVGEFNPNANDFAPRADGCYPVVWCVAAVGVCYPLTRETDYSKKRVHDGMQVSDYFGSGLNPGFDCHCVAVNESAGFQAVPRNMMQYMEIVFDQEVQVLPIAVLWVKPM